MVDYIINLINEILTGVNSGNNILIQSPESYNSTLYSGIISIMQGAAMPIAYSILGLLCMLELYNITIRTEGMNGNSFEIPFKTMFKIVVCKIFVDNTPLILNTIYSLSNSIIGNINGVVNNELIADIEIIREMLEQMDIMTLAINAIQVTIIWLLFKFCSMVISVIIVARMVEIYIYMAIAPIPLATVPNAEISSVAKNFIKSFAAVCVQGAFIGIVLSMYSILIQGIASTNLNNFTDIMLEATLYSLVLVVCIFMTGRWSKTVCNAM